MRRLALATVIAVLATGAGAVLAKANTVVGFGSNFHDALGVGYLSGGVFPSAPVQLPEAPLDFAASTAILPGGELVSWGGNTFGQVGDGRQWIQTAYPVAIAREVVQADGDCALQADGTALGWGGNTYGQAGQGVPGGGNEQGGIQTAVTRPTPIKGLAPGRVVALDCDGPAHYALYATGNLYGWGNGSQSELGQPAQAEVLKPRLVAEGVVETAADGASKYEGILLMRHADGSVFALGSNNRGQAGIGKTSRALTKPTRVKLAGPAVAIAASHSNGMALLADGTLETWGREDGTGTPVECGSSVKCDPTPHPVALAHGATSIAEGFSVGYAVVAGNLVTWGANDSGGAGAKASEGVLPPAVRMTGAVRVRAAGQPNGVLVETTGAWAPAVLKGHAGPGRAVTVEWPTGLGKVNIGLTECTGGPKERATKSHSVGRTEGHEFTVPVPHAGEWEVSVGGVKFTRKTVRVNVPAVAIHHRKAR